MKLNNLSIKYKWILTAYIIGACSIIIILILLTGLKNSREDFKKFKSDYYEVEQLVKDNTITILTTAKDIRDAYIQDGKQSNSSLEQNKLAFEELINSNFYYFNSNNYEYAGGTSYYYKIVDTVDFKGTDHTEIISISKDDEYYYVLY